MMRTFYPEATWSPTNNWTMRITIINWIFVFVFYFQILNAHKTQPQPYQNDLLGFDRNLMQTQFHSIDKISTELPNDGMVIDAGTITPAPTPTQLNDIFLAVKTTEKNHAKRLTIIAKTWFQMAREQVILFSHRLSWGYTNKWCTISFPAQVIWSISHFSFTLIY